MAELLGLPSQAELAEIFDFDAITGVLRWKDRPEWGAAQKARRVGAVAGSLKKGGVIRIGLNGQDFLAHRIIYKLVNGIDPPEIYRVDVSAHPNFLENREVVRTTWPIHSLPKGVYRKRYKYAARIRRAGVLKHLGTFDTIEAAARAYEAAADG